MTMIIARTARDLVTLGCRLTAQPCSGRQRLRFGPPALHQQLVQRMHIGPAAARWCRCRRPGRRPACHPPPAARSLGLRVGAFRHRADREQRRDSGVREQVPDRNERRVHRPVAGRRADFVTPSISSSNSAVGGPFDPACTSSETNGCDRGPASLRHRPARQGPRRTPPSCGRPVLEPVERDVQLVVARYRNLALSASPSTPAAQMIPQTKCSSAQPTISRVMIS